MRFLLFIHRKDREAPLLPDPYGFIDQTVRECNVYIGYRMLQFVNIHWNLSKLILLTADHSPFGVEPFALEQVFVEIRRELLQVIVAEAFVDLA